MSKVRLSYMIQRGDDIMSRDVEQRTCKDESEAQKQLAKAMGFLSRFGYRITWSEIRPVTDEEQP